MRRALGFAAVLGALAFPSGAIADDTPLGLVCVPREGVRFCEGNTANRVPGWEGQALLDTNVALPASTDTDLPLVILMHGWGGSKQGFAAMKPWAERGYAVLSYTSRGFNNSCGSLATRLQCPMGWIKLMDTRYEVRDGQHLAGLLADEGTVDGQRVGATGPSYGGGYSMALAVLRDRVMNSNGSYSPWTSPGGRPMRIAGAAPTIPWTDLAYSLVPNGGTLDYLITSDNPADPAGDDLAPVGVMKQSFVAGLYALGQSSGYYSPPGADSGADLNQWYALTNAGEPYDSNPQTRGVVTEIASHHSSYYLDDDRAPAPLFISNGWTDDLFPPDEALRFYNRLRSTFPASPIKLMFFDFGHQRGQGKDADEARLESAIAAWLDHYVKGTGPAPANDVTTLTQTCPATAPSGGPFTAPTWAGIQPGEVRQTFAPAQTLLSNGGDPSVNRAVDPIAGGGACATTGSGNLQGTATYRFARAIGGYTLMGSPTVAGRFAVSGVNSQIAARLWDVAPDGNQTLVARSLYRPGVNPAPGGVEVFQLHANGWRFAPGHQPKLELLGNDAPYGRASNGAFQISASNVDIRLPVLEQPGASSGQVTNPAGFVVPRGGVLARGAMRLSARLRYRTPRRRARAGQRRRRACWSSVLAIVGGQGLGNVARVDFRLGRRHVAWDGRRPFSKPITRRSLRRARSRTLRLRAFTRDRRIVTVTRRLRSC